MNKNNTNFKPDEYEEAPRGKHFNLDAYLDALFGDDYNKMEDADLDEDKEDVATYLSSCKTKDLVISLIISLCLTGAVSIRDIVIALDTLKDQQL